MSNPRTQNGHATTWASPSGVLRAPSRRLFDPLAFAPALLVSATLGLAAYGKLGFGDPGAFDVAIAVGEIGFILALLALHARTWIWGAVALLFATFAGYTGQRLATGTPCGCFGELTIFGLDLFKTPVTFSMDLIGVAIGLTMLARGLARGAPLVGPALTVAAAAATGGAIFGALTMPPPATDFIERTGLTAVQTLVTSPEFAESLRAADPDSAARLLYVYDPTCHICQEHLPEYQADIAAHANDPTLRTHIVSMRDLANRAVNPIEEWAWMGTPPITLLLEGGVVTRQGDYRTIMAPAPLREELRNSPTPLGALLRSSLARDAARAGADDPAWLVYIYDPAYPVCVRTLLEVRRYTEANPDDPALRAIAVSVVDAEREAGAPAWAWPSSSTAYLIRAGEVVAVFGDDAEEPLPELDALRSRFAAQTPG